MLLDALRNIAAFTTLAVKAAIKKLPGLRWPMVNWIEGGLLFKTNGKIVEAIIFNQLAATPLLRQCLIGKRKDPLVLVASADQDATRVNVYRVVKDTQQTDLAIPTNSLPGQNGFFHYLLLDGKLRYANRATSYTRLHGFYWSEPVLSIHIPHTENTRQAILDQVLVDMHLQEDIQQEAIEVDGKDGVVFHKNGHEFMTVLYE